ncbi:MAG TPA: ice-binding family protein [Patescibacteria group bacterium]|nr:ice-binding family protein [Patescibacteria group bacterium]
MELFHRYIGGVMALSLVLSLIGPVPVSAATAPSLGLAESYAVFGKAGVTNDSAVGTTNIWGDVGADASVTFLDDATQVDGTINVPAAGIEAAILSAYNALDAEEATGSLNLAGTNTVTPGVYTVGATTLNGTLTLNGPGVYIFRSSSSVTVSTGAQMLLTNGATSCNVYWQIPAAMTIGVGAEMIGTIIADSELISLDTNATLEGRAFSRIAQVTMDSTQITEPTCAVPSSGGSSSSLLAGTITVVKTVINDNGGTSTVGDVPLFVNDHRVYSGVTYNYPTIEGGALFTVTETADPNYTQAFSGDCDENGELTLTDGESLTCVITNDDIGEPAVVPPVPPLIDLVKVPSPLALPDGPGLVQYTYTLRNIGTVPVTDITMVGDTCSPIGFESGDTDNDEALDVNETWVYQCAIVLSQTHTNIVTATGWANGISTSDIASATVVVGEELVPPLIHVTKVPDPLALLAGGGTVTYTETITNPGTEPLSNVTLTDDKCSPVNFVSGDTNNDTLLDPAESWVYTCDSTITKTTTNTATASAQANGITARDTAIVTVIVTATAVPSLPVAGFFPANIGYFGVIVGLPLLLIMSLYAFTFVQRKATK